MKSLKRWFSLRFQVRVWRGKAHYWRARSRELERLLAAEALRNREREDVFVSASILGAKGMFGLPPRSGPAVVPRHAQPATTSIVPTVAGWDRLTWAEKTEFDQFWKNDIPAGMTVQDAQSQFVMTVMNRKALNDEPSN